MKRTDMNLLLLQLRRKFQYHYGSLILMSYMIFFVAGAWAVDSEVVGQWVGLSTEWRTLLIFLSILIASLWFIWKRHNWFNEVLKRYDGELLEYDRSPTPAISMERSLAQADIPLGSICKAALVTEKMPNKYLDDSHLMRGMTAADIVVVGRREKSCGEGNQSSRIRYLQSREKITEHQNLLITKDGRRLVWYEPEHLWYESTREGTDGIHLMPQGAFLIEIREDIAKRVEDEIRKLLESKESLFPSLTERAKRTLDELVSLDEGWDGYNGIPVLPEVAEHARLFLKRVEKYTNLMPDIIPLSNGGLQLEWYVGKYEIEAEIEPDCTTILLFEDRGDERSIEVSLDATLDLSDVAEFFREISS